MRYGEWCEAFSTGTQPSLVNKHAIQVMGEIGIDISGQRSKSLVEYYGEEMDVVVTMCDTSAAVCPLFPWVKRDDTNAIS